MSGVDSLHFRFDVKRRRPVHFYSVKYSHSGQCNYYVRLLKGAG